MTTYHSYKIHNLGSMLIDKSIRILVGKSLVFRRSQVLCRIAAKLHPQLRHLYVASLTKQLPDWDVFRNADTSPAIIYTQRADRFDELLAGSVHCTNGG